MWRIGTLGPIGRVGTVAIVASMASIGVGLWLLAYTPAIGRPEALRELIAAVGPSFVADGRLTGRWATRGTGATALREPLRPAVLVAIAKIRQLAEATPTPDHLHALGIAELVQRDYDAAVTALEAAVARRPQSAAFLNDLAVAYLARARTVGRAEDTPKALATIERATVRDPRHRDVRFNRALLLDALSLHHGARQAFDDYLAIDAIGPWADEARRRRAALSPSILPEWTAARANLLTALDRGHTTVVDTIVHAFPQAARELFEDELLSQWAGTTDDAALARPAMLAAALSRERGDAFFIDTVRHLQQATPAIRGIAADAFRRYHTGRELQQRERTSDAADPFREATTLLTRASSPFAARAEVEAGYALYFRGRLAESAAVLDGVRRASQERRYPTLAARASITLGVVQFAAAEFAKAVDSERQALALYEQLREWENLASVHQALAEPLRAMGELREAWTHVDAALRLVPRIRDPRRRQMVLASSALGAFRQDLPAVAVALMNEDLAIRPQAELPLATAASLLFRGRAWARLGDDRRAAIDLAAAEERIARITDEAARRRMEAELAAVQGDMLARSAPARAIASLTVSLARYADIGSRFRLATLHLARGRAYLRTGDRAAARADFAAGIAALEAEQASIADDRLRVSHFDGMWDLYGELIRLEADDGRVDEAFDAAERSRARSLRRMFGARATALSLTDVRARLDAGTTVLAYALVERRLHVWVIRRDAVSFVTKDVDPGTIAAALDDTDPHAAGPGRAAAFARAAVDLYDLLIAPAERALTDTARLVIVPDGLLYRVPFAGLSNRQTGRILVEAHDLTMSHSVRLFVQARAAPADGVRALVVANPALGPSALPPLRFADREARAIAGLYPDTRVLRGAQATRAAFLADLPAATLLHFAGHAIASEDFPWLSRLMLAGAGDAAPADALFAHELPSRTLGRLRLVVLAACHTGAGVSTRGEGLLNLARPFLLGGVPHVVISHWAIEDDVAAAFFARFHQHYAQIRDPVRALAITQREMRQSGDSRVRDPRAWAGYTVISGVGAYRTEAASRGGG